MVDETETAGPGGGIAIEDEGADFADAGGASVLDQEEIDSLLGFNDESEARPASGIEAILDSTLVAYERLPMLEVVYDRMVRLMTTSLRNFTSDNVEVSLDNVVSHRFGDYLNMVPLPAIIGVFCLTSAPLGRIEVIA